MRPLAILALCAALVACGDDDGPPRPVIGDPVVLERGAVDTTVTADSVVDGYRPEGAPPGSRFAGFSITWVDRGRPFPRDAARFALVDDAGHRETVARLSPLRAKFADRGTRDNPRTQIVALALGEGREPRRLELESIDPAWRFSAHWNIDG